MVTHYFTTPETVACGRSGTSLNGSQDMAQVSCKLCLRTVEKKAEAPVRKTPSLAELRAAAKAAKAEALAAAAAVEVEVEVKVETATGVAKPSSTLTPRAEWQKRLEQLPGRNRLPRGAARQTFI